MGWSYDYFVYVKAKDVGRFEMFADAKSFCNDDAKKAHQKASIKVILSTDTTIDNETDKSNTRN